MKNSIMRTHFLIVLTISGLLLNAQPPPNSHSLEKEAALGRQLAANFSQRTINDGAVQEYLERLVQRMAPYVPEAKFPFSPGVIFDDHCETMHEAVALPGGYIFVPAALFLAAESEAEFAGMVAQAMQRIATHDGIKRFAGDQPSRPDTIPLIFTGGGCSEGPMIPFARRTDGSKSEADALAVQTMARAGFDPAALVRYIERTQPFPDRDHRAATMRAAMERLPQLNYEVRDEEFKAIQGEVRSLTGRGRTVR